MPLVDLIWAALAAVGALLLIVETTLSSIQAWGVICIFSAFVAQVFWEVSNPWHGTNSLISVIFVIVMVFGVPVAARVLQRKKQKSRTKRVVNDETILVTLTTEEQAKREQHYETMLLEQRSLTLRAVLDQSNSFDKWILTLAAGTFGLSLAFMNQMTSAPTPGTRQLLITSWILFAISIASTICSFLLSQKACRRQLHDIEDELLRRSRDEKPDPFGRLTSLLNYASGTTFITGVVCLMAFAINNLGR